jgi:hypothetical protein
MTWVLVIGAAWLALALPVAVLIGRSVRLADARARADAELDEPNFVVDPATAPRGFPAAKVLPPRAGAHDAPSPSPSPGWDTPTIPGIPVARPPARGTRNTGSQIDPIRRSGLG